MRSSHENESLGTIPGLIILGLLVSFLYCNRPAVTSQPEKLDLPLFRTTILAHLQQDLTASQSIGLVSAHFNDGQKSVLQLDNGRFIAISPVFNVDVGVEVRKASSAAIDNAFGPGAVIYCLNGDQVSCYFGLTITDIKKKTSQSTGASLKS